MHLLKLNGVTFEIDPTMDDGLIRVNSLSEAVINNLFMFGENSPNKSEPPSEPLPRVKRKRAQTGVKRRYTMPRTTSLKGVPHDEWKLSPEEKETVSTAVNNLDERLTGQERAVLRARFFGPPKLQRKVASELDIDPRYVTSLTRSGLKKLSIKRRLRKKPRRQKDHAPTIAETHGGTA